MIKRTIDILASVVALMFLSPFLGCIAILITIRHEYPFLFLQTRPGLGGIPFQIYKFRTMSNARDTLGNLLPDEQRISKLGAFLRSTSLDELPELFNVLKGDMSLVGPRPLLMQYLDHYTPEQARRHEVKPGITGWAQINGRNALTWEEKFKLDVWYADHQSTGLDIKIIVKTIEKVLKRSDISADGHATMPEFMGKGETNT